MHWVATASGSLSLWSGLQQILVSLALPFVAGQLLRPWLIEFLQPHKHKVNLLDRSVIVLIVYSSFCEATAQGMWQRFSYGQLAIALLLVSVLLAVMLTFTRQAAKLAGFSRAEEVAVVFCGSKKSLAGGAPIARVLFAAHPGLALIMLPLMLYHQIQLLACTILARRYAAAADEVR
jgi:sodium/bile acid cotransporter 7